ncbi:MAG: ketol-acid reductoisomerase [Gemmatimonadetes bacterium]|nr:ketol-acid reductoisomerase [Gemmatimonadota bacterium]
MLSAEDVDPKLLAARRLAIIGYGSQGAAHARILHMSGADVRVGLRDGSGSAEAVRGVGITLRSVPEAVKEANLVAVLIPDTAQAKVYREEIAPHLKGGDALLFAHGFNIHFGQINPPKDVDVIMVAPKSPGPMLYREASQGNGVPSLIAVHQDATGRARDVALAYAHGLGSTRAGVLETTFAEETETDLFGEQAVLCGGLSSLILAGFETLVEAGYQPEVAYFECLHEVKLIVDLIYQGGLTGMRKGVSDTAEWGDYVSGPRVIGAASRKAMQEILAEIRSGEFAKRWIAEGQGSQSEFNRLRAEGRKHQIEEVGARLRSRMAWLSGSGK